MINHKDEITLDILNNLIKTLKESESIYKAAAVHIHDEALKEVFLTYAEQKADYAEKLQHEVTRLGGRVSYGFSEDEEMPEYMADDEPPAQILNDCESREAKAIFNYERAMNEDDVLWEVIPIVSKQYMESKQSYYQIQYIKNSMSQAFA